jgi:hypothetical protein
MRIGLAICDLPAVGEKKLSFGWKHFSSTKK